MSQQQWADVIAVLDIALTDTFYTLLMGLAGTGSLGGSQQEYRLSGERSQPTSSTGEADLEALTFEIFSQVSDNPAHPVCRLLFSIGMIRYDLTDFEWSVIEPMQPTKPQSMARLPERYGSRPTCYNRFVRSRVSGIG